MSKLYCTSAKCCGHYNFKPIEKKVEPGTAICPDCGFFLMKQKTRHQPGRKRIGSRSSAFGV